MRLYEKAKRPRELAEARRLQEADSHWALQVRAETKPILDRTDPSTLLYEFTVADPATWTRPWTAAIPMSLTAGPIYEYACHEGNSSLAGILAGARADEKSAAEAAKNASK